jgi:20S proteasome alpha/beta subunit
MTTVTYKSGAMAADTRMVQASTIFGDVTKIVRRDDGALCGGCGSIAWVQSFHRWFLDGQVGDPPKAGEYDRAMICGVGAPVRVFEHAGKFEFYASFVAIGSGKEFALGAMSYGATAEDAVRVAMAFDPGTGGDVMVLTHDGK